MKYCHFAVATFVVCLLSFAQSAQADSWMPPEERAYLSSNGQYRLTVTPRDIASPLAYFSDKVEGREPAGVRTREGITEPRGVLQRRGDDGTWEIIWQNVLVNEVAPVSALVADTGDYGHLR